MAKVSLIPRARMDHGKCGKCGKEIMKGDAYYTWAFYRQRPQNRCADHRPNRSETTQNAVLQAAYGITEEIVEPAESVDDFDTLCKDLAERIRDEVMTAAQETMDNLEETWPNAYQDMEAYQLNEERLGEAETWADEVEQVADDWSDEDEYNAEEATDALQQALANCPF